jgi:hypothetical protein
VKFVKLLSSPINSFTSAKGRRFTLSRGERRPERFPGDTIGYDSFPILYEGKRAGLLFRSLNYGRTAKGKPRWHASTRELYWTYAADAPTGVGFDVAAFDSARECLAAWGRSADQILDWEEGKPVQNGYSKTGVSQKAARA